jgi:transcriptional regulator with XRE-family HTH domain
MKERILEFLRVENKTSAQLADEIGVQASGISHILSGRNNPSLDFVLKMLDKYKYISTDWLLFGKGTMYKDSNMQSLFDGLELNDGQADARKAETPVNNFPPVVGSVAFQPSENPEKERNSLKDDNELKKIVLLYRNGTFEEYEKSK